MNAMEITSRQLRNVVAFAIGLIGLYVLMGWMLRSEAMVRIVPNSVAMGFNAACMFIAAAICLKATRLHSLWDRSALICSWLLIVLPGAILYEHWSGANLGIDWTSLHATVKDGNPNPGRVAPNTCMAFLSAGFVFLILRRRSAGKMQSYAVGFLIGCTLVIGLLGLVGYGLGLEALYQWAVYNRMAAPTAVGIGLLGFGMWLQWCERESTNVSEHRPDQQITRMAAMLLTIVALVAGLMGFAVLKRGFEQSLSDAFLRTAKSSSSTFLDTIEVRMVMADSIAARPGLQKYLDTLSRDPTDQGALQLARKAGQSTLSSGVTGLRLFNAQGNVLTTVGTLVGTRAEMALPLQHRDDADSLLWQDGFVLQTKDPVAHDGRVVGSVLVEQRLVALTAQVRAIQKEGQSTDLIVCGRQKQDAVCFPSRFYAANLHIPIFKDGKLYLPISHALLGETGVVVTKDFRGISVFAAYIPAGSLGLGIVLKTDTQEMFNSIRSRLNLLAALLIGLIAAGTLVLRRQVHPLAQRLVNEQRRTAVILEISHEAFIAIDQAGLITDWNAEATNIFGWNRIEVVGQELATLIIPTRSREAHRQGIARFLATGNGPVLGKRIELQAINRAGGEFPVEITISAIPSDLGFGFSAFLRDISSRKQIAAALFNEKERLRVTLGSIGDAVITTDTNGRVTYLNPVAETMTGWSLADASGVASETIFKIVNDLTGEPALDPVDQVLRHAKTAGLAEFTTLIHRTGIRFPIEDSAAPIRNADGEILGVVLVFHDVTQTRKMAVEMTYQATHDALTGLINRQEFERRLDHAIESGNRQPTQHTMLYMDLDQFKIVNDTCGHFAGDELLRQLAAVMQEKLRRGDTLARLGGDEFAVLLENCGNEPANRIADTLLRTVGDFQFVWLDKTFSIGVSIGLVTFANGGTSAADILRLADAACYVAKDSGRNRIHIYTPDDRDLAQRSGEMGWISRIKKALLEQRFVLYAQKILSLTNDNQEEIHYEVLLRMHDEQGELVPPMAFIPAAERYGIMPQIDRWVIKTAFSSHAKRPASQTGRGTCAINLSAASICDEHFIEFVKDQFARHGVSPRNICFEITETSAITNLSKAAVLIRELKQMGCRFALDDFGSGMASFAYLKHLPVDYLKIDGGFVKDMMHDPIDRAMVDSINNIGHIMGIQTIAEFVENAEILDALKGMGVDFAQGYGVETPQPL